MSASENVQLRSFSPSALPDCPICKGTGWEIDAATRRARRCVCRKSNHVESLLEKSRIPPRYRLCTLESYQPDPHQNSQVNAGLICKNFVKDFFMPDGRGGLLPNGIGLLLLGPCGVGKTHLATAIINNLITRRNVPCLFYDFRDLLKEIQESYNPNTQTSELKVLAPVYEAEVLVLDELGANKPTEWVKDTMTQIINTRYNEKKVTIFTSNYLDSKNGHYDESLTDRIGIRLRSRLYEMCRIVEIQGDDYRRKMHPTPGPSIVR
jgi:DNA replication protein DnaC